MIKMCDLALVLDKIIRKSCFGNILVFFAPHKYLSVNNENVVFAKEFLNHYSMDPATSCITHNNINEIVDLNIIIPAYNVEKYICQCIDSIVNSSKKITYCLTIINDGSTDLTGELLKKYSSVPQVEVITQKNKGFSGARNSGLKNIKGRYISFVDSDDWVDWNVLEKMVQFADKNNADMVEGGYYIVDEFGKVRKKIKSNHSHYYGFPWGKIYRSEKFKNVCFPEKYWYEDTIIEQVLFENMPRKFSFSDAVYYYRQRGNSITRVSRTRKKSVDSIWILLTLHHDREVLNIPLSQEYYEFVLRHIYLTYRRILLQGKNVQKEAFIVLSHFLKSEFPIYNTTDKKLYQFDYYIRNGDFGKWKFFCKWIEI